MKKGRKKKVSPLCIFKAMGFLTFQNAADNSQVRVVEGGEVLVFVAGRRVIRDSLNAIDFNAHLIEPLLKSVISLP